MTELEKLLELARELPAPVPDAAHREEVRTALLARARPAQAPSHRHRYLLALPIVAVAATAAIYVTTQPEPVTVAFALPVLPVIDVARARGHVHARAGARFETASELPDEIVELHDGTIDVEVDPLQRRERFRVLIGTGEVEVRGTAFSVSAEHDRLLEVHVVHGRVEVRPLGSAPVVLVAGGVWTVPAVVPPPIMIATHRKPSAPLPSADQLAYDTGWTALREARFEDAVGAFTHAMVSDPNGGLADDARYWQAVALARSKRSADATVAFRALVDEHPGSSHTAEASVMLGWLLVDASQLKEARERLAVGVDDANANVRASARAGIAAIDRARPH